MKEGDRSNCLARNYFPEHNDPFHSPKEQKYLDYTKSVEEKKGGGGEGQIYSVLPFADASTRANILTKCSESAKNLLVGRRVKESHGC